ncbi:MAG: MBL fold metallo-hydrolase, partial [Polyangia bacterium]
MCPPFVGKMVCHVLAIESDDGIVLVDTGLGMPDVATPKERLGRDFVAITRPRCDASETAIAQLKALGFSAKDVRHIVVTHLDLD